MRTKPIADSVKLPPKSLNEDTRDGELPEANIDDQRKPPVSMGICREAGDGVPGSDPEGSAFLPRNSPTGSDRYGREQELSQYR
ncbi:MULTISPECIES: hypothetical protein [unclassified Rhizobium]|uniref:hypothetical protein n=1 Tax=unclassified Rhizobium TaxID=2613769 RepID=UPI002180BBB9|nr:MULTISPECIES: hypothetical protein [unclassified Rhizobium]